MTDPKLHRIEIPEEFGGGYVDIKAKRSWADTNRIAGAGFHVRQGVTQDEIAAAQAEGRMTDLMVMDAHARLATPLEQAIVVTSEGLKPEAMSVGEWLEFEVDEDLGDFLMRTVAEHYDAQAAALRAARTAPKLASDARPSDG